MVSKTTDNPGANTGPQLRRRESRRGFAALITCGIVATFANLLIGDGVVPSFLRESLAPRTAVALAAGFLLLLALIAWLGRGLLDEHETGAAAYGQAAACGVVVVAYPVWYLLWKGGLVQEPSHASLFATLLLVSWGGYAYRKYV